MKEISPPLKQALEAVAKDGTNIFMLMNRLKKQINTNRKRKGLPKANVEFPEEALLKVCQSYWKYKPVKSWPWFIKVINQESQLFLANEQVKQHAAYKRSKPAASFKQGLRALLEN